MEISMAAPHRQMVKCGESGRCRDGAMASDPDHVKSCGPFSAKPLHCKRSRAVGQNSLTARLRRQQ
jgi:hypothetical protein